MSWNNKVIWSEGLFLQPQHLQQQDRFLQSFVEQRSGRLRPFAWGFTHLELDEALLALGKVGLRAARGVLPDGTPFSVAEDGPLPAAVDVPEQAKNALVVLALPARREGMPECDPAEQSQSLARYAPQEYEAADTSSPDANHRTAPINIGHLRLRLALAAHVVDAYTTLGVARVVERRAAGLLVLDSGYVPPCLDFRVSPRLSSWIDELLSLLKHRADALAGRLAQPGVSGVAEVSDFLMLQSINQLEPVMKHLASIPDVHPETLYRMLVQAAGEYATFTRADKRAGDYPLYRHDALAESFLPVLEDLRRSLSMVIDSRAIPIPIELRKHGVRTAVVPDQTLFKSATFILAVNASVASEKIRTNFPTTVKIGPVEKIRDLVNLALPGIGLRALPVAPRQLPFHAGFTYFELDRSSEMWREMPGSGGFAMFVQGDYPGLELEFWAIRG